MNELEINNVIHEVHQNELLRFEGRIDGHDAVILFDLGFPRDFLSVDLVQKHQISLLNLEDQFAVAKANGRTSSTAQTSTEPLTSEKT